MFANSLQIRYYLLYGSGLPVYGYCISVCGCSLSVCRCLLCAHAVCLYVDAVYQHVVILRLSVWDGWFLFEHWSTYKKKIIHKHLWENLPKFSNLFFMNCAGGRLWLFDHLGTHSFQFPLLIGRFDAGKKLTWDKEWWCLLNFPKSVDM